LGSPYTPTSAAGERTKYPAMGLMAVAGIGILAQAASIVMNLLGMGGVGMAGLPQGEGMEGIAALMSGGVGIALSLFTMLIGALIAFGAYKMMNLESYALSMAAAVIAMLPCLSPCCCLGVPIGIWAIVVLVDADVKAAFRG
jgi:hypothetical protein